MDPGADDAPNDAHCSASMLREGIGPGCDAFRLGARRPACKLDVTAAEGRQDGLQWRVPGIGPPPIAYCSCLLMRLDGAGERREPSQ